MSSRDDRQLEAVEKWIKNRCNGTWEFCTGFGKTTAAIIAINRFIVKNPRKKIIVIVPTDYLRGQWISILDKKGLSFNAEVKIINSAIKQPFFCDLLILD